MSLANSPDYFLRPEDKALKILFPSVEDDNTFDDFFNGRMYGNSEDSDNESQPGQTQDLFSESTLAGGATQLRPARDFIQQDISPPQPWRKGLWCLNQAKSSNIKVEKSRKHENLPETISTAHLLNNDNFATRTPRSPPDSPLVKGTKRSVTRPNAARAYYNARPSPSREMTLSPSPMYAILPDQDWPGATETWQQDFQNFHLRMPENGLPISPPTSTRVGHHECTNRERNAAVMAHNASIGMAVSDHSRHYVPPSGQQYFVGTDIGLIDPRISGQHTQMQSGPPEEPQIPSEPYHSEQPPIPVWTAESLHSLNSSHHSYDPHQHSSNSGYSDHSSHSAHVQSYWQPHTAAYSTQVPVTSEGYQRVLAAPTAQRLPHHILQHVAEHPQGGLGIHYPELEQMNQAIYHEPHPHVCYHNIPPGTAMPYSPSAVKIPHMMGNYPPLPPSQNHTFADKSPFTTPRKQRNSPSRSPSPSVSPTSNSSRTLRHRSPTRTDHGPHRHRRKSIHKSGPMKDTHGHGHSHESIPPLPPLNTSTASLPSSHSRARSRSTSAKPPRTPRTPKTPTSSKDAGGLDFVNFTPRDSAKLLSDVAPSGSSKTRARREQEARDKRKRLSEAALRAVRKAGGNERDLEAIILS